MPTRLLVTGGEQRENAAWHKAFHHYRKGLLAAVDFETRSVARIYEHVTAPEYRSDPMPSIVFKSATLANGRLYLSTETEVLVLSYPELRPLRHLTHPAFNDLHHVVPWKDGLMVVSTGLDIVIVFDAEYRAVDFLPVLDEAPWSRFSPHVDYRKVASTKPHLSHPNFLFTLGGEPWVTRCLQKDAVCLLDRTKRIEIGIAQVHDGIVVGDYVYFTAVDGHIAVAHGRTHKVECQIDLTSISETETPLGWCRGLYVDGNRAYVGFSRLRPTKLYENLRWLRNRIAAGGAMPTEVLPTRIAVYDLTHRRQLDELILEDAGLGAVFSILADDADCTQLAHEYVPSVSA